MTSSTQASRMWMNEPLTPLDFYRRSITNPIYFKRSPLQQICIAEAGAYGKALILDGQLQTAVADEFLYHEALVHPPMIQASAPRDVLIVGGGDGAAAREALRWRSVARVTVVEMDWDVVAACREHLPEIHQNAFENPRLEIVIGDGYHFLRDTDRSWDVIILDLPDPADGVPWLRLYRRECFDMARDRLSREGSFVLQAGPISPLHVEPLSRIAREARAAFPCVHVYSTFVPSYGIPLAFVAASARPFDQQDPETIDRMIAGQIRGRLRLLDGAALLGLMQTPVYVRDAVRVGLEIAQ